MSKMNGGGESQEVRTKQCIECGRGERIAASLVDHHTEDMVSGLLDERQKSTTNGDAQDDGSKYVNGGAQRICRQRWQARQRDPHEGQRCRLEGTIWSGDGEDFLGADGHLVFSWT